MTNIYDQHQTAFKNTSAYVVLDKNGTLVARVAFKRGDAVTCYFHVMGCTMTKGHANGGGYDRNSASAYDAIMKTQNPKDMGTIYGQNTAQLLARFKEALAKGNGGSHWDSALQDAGYAVFQAV